jgi:hypothetical protein
VAQVNDTVEILCPVGTVDSNGVCCKPYLVGSNSICCPAAAYNSGGICCTIGTFNSDGLYCNFGEDEDKICCPVGVIRCGGGCCRGICQAVVVVPPQVRERELERRDDTTSEKFIKPHLQCFPTGT